MYSYVLSKIFNSRGYLIHFKINIVNIQLFVNMKHKISRTWIVNGTVFMVTWHYIRLVKSYVQSSSLMTSAKRKQLENLISSACLFNVRSSYKFTLWGDNKQFWNFTTKILRDSYVRKIVGPLSGVIFYDTTVMWRDKLETFQDCQLPHRQNLRSFE